MITAKSMTRSIKIDEVDQGIFTKKYFAYCLNYGCADMCCWYGCQTDGAEKARILMYATQLEARLGMPASQWFEKEIVKDSDYPSGETIRTRVHRDRCVFYNHRLRGCELHRFAVEKGMDCHLLKPMICSLFPVSWEWGRLSVSSFLDELPCKDCGVSVFEAQKEELTFYFGTEFVSELEKLALEIQKSTSKPLDIGSF